MTPDEARKKLLYNMRPLFKGRVRINDTDNRILEVLEILGFISEDNPEEKEEPRT